MNIRGTSTGMEDVCSSVNVVQCCWCSYSSNSLPIKVRGGFQLVNENSQTTTVRVFIKQNSGVKNRKYERDMNQL